MRKIIFGLIPLLLANSCEPVVINVATNDATLADKVYNYLTNYWYSDIFYEDIDIKDAAIAQFISSITSFDVSKQLDPYTYIITNKEETKETSGKVGITTTNIYNYPVVVDVNKDGTAYGNIQVGDIVYGIGIEDEDGNVNYHYIMDETYKFSNFLDYASIDVGKNVYYKVKRFEDNKFNSYDYTMTLVEPFDSLDSYEVITDIEDTLMVKISSFTSKTATQFANVLKLNEESENKKHNLIIDLRDNGGGKVTAAVDCCDLLLEGIKKVLSIVGKDEVATEYNTALKLGDYLFDKYVILVNGSTASASEIMVKCLDYYLEDKLEIIGNTTFGKGLVTNTVSLDEDKKYSLQYLAGKWLDPKDEYMEYKTGISPDKEVSISTSFETMKKYRGYVDYTSNLKYDTVSSINIYIANILNDTYSYDIRTDGYFDLNYEEKVKSYQLSKNIEQTGSIDEETYLYLVYDYYFANNDFNDAHLNKAKEFING